jgi:hypothetical protein
MGVITPCLRYGHSVIYAHWVSAMPSGDMEIKKVLVRDLAGIEVCQLANDATEEGLWLPKAV